MGGQVFQTVAAGTTAEDAFSAARATAQYEHGHGGYSGTIAEKRGFVMVERAPMSRQAARAKADEMIDAGDPRIDDKWGPAGCIPLDDGRFFFFGWASS